MLIQMVTIDEDTSLFLYGFNDNNELVFRTSRNPGQIQHEKIVVKDNFCYLNLYYFPIDYLKKLPKEPVDNQGNIK